jgi:hypothetical protein
MRSWQEFRCSFVASLETARGRRKGIERRECSMRGLLQPQADVCVRACVSGLSARVRDKYGLVMG